MINLLRNNSILLIFLVSILAYACSKQQDKALDKIEITHQKMIRDENFKKSFENFKHLTLNIHKAKNSNHISSNTDLYPIGFNSKEEYESYLTIFEKVIVDYPELQNFLTMNLCSYFHTLDLTNLLMSLRMNRP